MNVNLIFRGVLQVIQLSFVNVVKSQTKKWKEKHLLGISFVKKSNEKEIYSIKYPILLIKRTKRRQKWTYNVF
jgi:hypothetical protein